MTLKLAETSVVNSRPSVPYGANFFIILLLDRFCYLVEGLSVDGDADAAMEAGV